MVKVELDSTDGPLYCPLCGLALITKNGFEPPCQHVVFMGIGDEEIEYFSPELNEEELRRRIEQDGMERGVDSILGQKTIRFSLFSESPLSNFSVHVVVRTDLLLEL